MLPRIFAEEFGSMAVFAQRQLVLPFTFVFGKISEAILFDTTRATNPRIPLMPTKDSDSILRRNRPVRLIDDAKRKQAALLFEKKIGYKRVAAMLDLSPYTVRDWSRQWKKGRFSEKASRKLYEYSEEFKREVVRLRAGGNSWRELQEKTGISPATCRRWMGQYLDEVEKAKKSKQQN